MCQYPKQLKVRSGRIRNPGKQARCAGAAEAEERSMPGIGAPAAEGKIRPHPESRKAGALRRCCGS
ncbi:hypothetical protein [Bacillus sp. FSL W8-1202]|uniref:hypothetical protein n=1 Tax=Bacillus TaxID=1386 RepID=UPI0030F50725